MKILIGCYVPTESLNLLLADNVIYRPDLELKGGMALRQTLAASNPDIVWLCRWPKAVQLGDWCGDILLLKQAADVDGPAQLGQASVHYLANNDPEAAFLEALRYSEALSLHYLPQAHSPAHLAHDSGAVMIVGAGVVNLITALFLLREGYAVNVIDAGPDPRQDAEWTKFGCSRGGHDARMFTLTEADNYHDKDCSPGHSESNCQFRYDVLHGGWDVRESLHPLDEAWIQQFESVSPALAKIYEQNVLGFNAESAPLWQELREHFPQVFNDVVMRDDIIRLYSDPVQCQASAARHEALDSLLRQLDNSALKQIQPTLAEACDSQAINGAIETVGFTLNVHKFMARILDELEKHGSTFHWNTRVQSLLRDEHGQVAALTTEHGQLSAQSYVLSPGAYGGDLLIQTQSENQIHGVLGVWGVVPNLDSELTQSMKLARKGHIVEDANITVVTDNNGDSQIVIGSGYGYTGSDPENVDAKLLHALYQGVEDTAARYFPAAYAKAKADGSLAASQRYCVRPWTPSGLGVFEQITTAQQGVMVITGGHNTGGFAQAPAVAMATLAALRGESHTMHQLYHPQRLSRFMALLSGDIEQSPGSSQFVA